MNLDEMMTLREALNDPEIYDKESFLHRQVFWAIVWPIDYTLTSSFSLFVTLLSPFLLLLYIIDPSYFV